jgi:hypothetical protein
LSRSSRAVFDMSFVNRLESALRRFVASPSNKGLHPLPQPRITLYDIPVAVFVLRLIIRKAQCVDRDT